MPDDRNLYTIKTHIHTYWSVDSRLQRITSVPLAHVSGETLKVCGYYIPPLRMKSPVNPAVPCLQRIAKVVRPVLHCRSVVVFVRNAWEHFVNQHFQNWRPWQCSTRFYLRAKHIDDEIGGAYGTNGKNECIQDFVARNWRSTQLLEPWNRYKNSFKMELYEIWWETAVWRYLAVGMSKCQTLFTAVLSYGVH